jgi:hypothetical protein
MGSKKSGRRLAYNAEVHKTIIEHLRAGAYKVHAANAVGISIGTLDAWVKAGREGRALFVEFAREVDMARAQDAVRNQAIISAAAMRKIDGDWKAAAWNLERKFPKLYGKRYADNVDDKPGAAAEAELFEPAVHSPWLKVVQ